MNREQAMDAIRTVLASGLGFSNEQREEAIDGLNYLHREDTSVHNKWLAAVDEMEEYNIVGPNNDEYSLGVLHGWERAFRELKSKMAR